MRDAAIDLHGSPPRGTRRPRGAEAPPLDDMVGEGPVSRAPPRRGDITSAAVAARRLGGGRGARGKAPPGAAARLTGRIPRVKPLKALLVGAFGVALVGIVTNAMVFQRGHHPSPLFGLGRSLDGVPEAGERVAEAPAPAPAPAPASAPAEKTGAITSAPPAPAEPTPAPAAPVAPKPAPVRHAAKPHRDEAGKAKGAAARTEAAHPRPGHHAAAEVDAEAKDDPLAKLIDAPARRAKPAAKPATPHDATPAKADAKPDAKAKSAEAAPPRPHHRLAAVDKTKPDAKAD